MILAQRLAHFGPSCNNAGIMPRFVLLRHECPSEGEKPSHWDFMLESGDVLRTWDLRRLPASWAEALTQTPSNRDSTNRRSQATGAVVALPLPDHRLAYLDYEGPVTDHRGSVTQCDVGTYRLLEEQAESLTFQLSGTLLQGPVRLSKLSEADAWSLELLAD